VGGPVVPGAPFEIGASPFHVCPTGCCIHPILYFKNVAPLLVFDSFWFLAPSAAKSWRRTWKLRAWIWHWDKFYVLKLKLWLRSDSVSKTSSLRHSHCLATIAFLLDIYLRWHLQYCDGSITVMWSLNVFINDFPLPSCRVKN